MADSSEIDNALVAKLGADATLLGYVPDGVHFGRAPQGSKRFVVVSLVDERDEPSFGGRAYEDALYRVEVMMLRTSNSQGGDPKSAFARIDTLLDGGTLTIPGYTLMTLHRESRDRFVEVDEADASIEWHRRAGNYRLQAST